MKLLKKNAAALVLAALCIIITPLITSYAAEGGSDMNTETIMLTGVITTDVKIVTQIADPATKTLTVYVSRSRSGACDHFTANLNLADGVTADNNSVNLDFSSASKITLTSGSTTETWKIVAVLAGNPVLAGQYADPDVKVFNGKYYMYPTTDGFSGWSGTKFHCFSSDDLINWTDEGVILDVATDDVPWAVGSAWAPCIAEKDGKYYFYFCAKMKSGDSEIGVAVADDPAGPFVSTERPLLTIQQCRNAGIDMGQTIDPSIFVDDDGSTYLVFGNGRAAIARLNDDMVSLDHSTLRNINGLLHYCEALTITKHNGLYHFTWSCNDTGSPDYHVNYGVAKSLTDRVENKYTLLEKDTEKDILGTGHHCIFNIPGTDEYYIVYHRFFTPLGVIKDGFGFHRETCIDKLTFDPDTGLMNVVKPTLEGVEPRSLSESVPTEEPAKEPTSASDPVVSATPSPAGGNRDSGSIADKVLVPVLIVAISALIFAVLNFFKKK